MQRKKISVAFITLVLGATAAFLVVPERVQALGAKTHRLANVKTLHLIVPGVSVGAVRIGSKPSPNFFPELGKPEVKHYDDSSSYGWKCGKYECGVMIKTTISGTSEFVSNIYISEVNNFRTQSDIGVGSTFQQVKKAFPLGKKTQGIDVDFCWEVPGAGFCFYKGTVSSIDIFKPS